MEEVKAEIRAKLREFVSSEEGQALRLRLENIARKHYVHNNYVEDYLKYMNDNPCSFERNHAQASNFPYVWTMFSVPSQHVMGDCIEECLDKAIDASKQPRVTQTVTFLTGNGIQNTMA